MLTGSAVIRSAPARALFLASAVVSIAVLWWAHEMAITWTGIALSPIFFSLFTVLDQWGAAVELLILIGAVFLARPEWLRPAAQWTSDHVRAVALLTALVLSVGALIVYRNHPLSMDEYTVYFQSQVFAAGHLAGHFPPPLVDRLIPPGFQNYFLYVSHATGAVASGYWPGFALLLTPFTWLGIPWACNPVISALTLLVIHRLAMRLFDDPEAAGFAVLLTAASPVFFADGISYYSMSASLLANAIYALLLLRPGPLEAGVAGVVGSLALTLHNPLPHILFALPWLLWLARQKNGLRLLICLGAGYLPLGCVLGIGWFEFIHTLPGATAALVTNANKTVAAAFAPPTLQIVYARLIGVAKVWAWSVPGLLILASVGTWKLRHDALCRVLTASALATLLGYLLVPFDQGHGWGYRYFHSAWFVLPLLAAGLLRRRQPEGFATDDVRAFVTACALLSLVVGVGHRAVQIHEFIADDLAQLPRYAGDEPQVVFINPNQFYSTDLIQNDPWLRGSVIRMVSHGDNDDADWMRKRFPGMQRTYADAGGSVWLSRSDAARN